ncbi:MAG: hypothetical protein WCI87_09730 [Euryarchaeota archaeon]
MFKQLSFKRWLKQLKSPLTHVNTHFVPGDLRKFCEQQGDILQWDQSKKNYILTHGVSWVDWRFYKHPLPTTVYDVYMKYWKTTSFLQVDERKANSLGLISAKKLYNGRYGRIRFVASNISKEKVLGLLHES